MSEISKWTSKWDISLRWRHNERDSVSNYQPHDCLLNRLFRRRSKKTSKLRVTGLCVGNSPGTGEFPAQMASYAENVSIWWRHHVSRLSSQIEWRHTSATAPKITPVFKLTTNRTLQLRITNPWRVDFPHTGPVMKRISMPWRRHTCLEMLFQHSSQVGLIKRNAKTACL